MVSVIICSVNTSLLETVKNNVSATIGVAHEIIAINNLNSTKGICAVYNEGIALAKYPLLCFMHEDILIKTLNWGEKIAEVFKNKEIGLLGIAGSTVRSGVPSGWFPPAEFGTKPWRLNIIQGSKSEDRQEVHEYFNPAHESISEVTCIDGVWMCTTKEIAEEIKFDESLLKGFHGYDIDFSLSIGKHFKVLVTFDILLAHASAGNFNETWLMELFKVHEKHKALLPLNYEGYTNEEMYSLESVALKHFLKVLIKNKSLSRSVRKAFIKQVFSQKKITLFSYLKLLYRMN